jgi:hypothetical protein
MLLRLAMLCAVLLLLLTALTFVLVVLSIIFEIVVLVVVAVTHSLGHGLRRNTPHGAGYFAAHSRVVVHLARDLAHEVQGARLFAHLRAVPRAHPRAPACTRVHPRAPARTCVHPRAPACQNKPPDISLARWLLGAGSAALVQTQIGGGARSAGRTSTVECARPRPPAKACSSSSYFRRRLGCPPALAIKSASSCTTPSRWSWRATSTGALPAAMKCPQYRCSAVLRT